MREIIKSAVAIVSNPVNAKDTGEVAQGNYTLENGVLTMTDADGVPLRDENTGGRIEMRLLPGESETVAARRLTLKIHRAANGDQLAGFHKRIDYGRWGLA